MVSRLTFRGEDDAGIFARRGLNFLYIQFLQHLLATCGLLTLGHIGTEATNELLQLLAFLLRLGLLVLLLTESQLTGLIPEAVVAGKEVDLTVIDIHRMGADRVEEVTVVAHNKHGMFEVGEILLQPGHGIHIQVIGRLVEQQVVGITKKCLGQHDAHLLLVVELAHHHIVLILLDAQSTEQGCRIALRIPAIQLGKLLLQLRHLQAILVGKIRLGIECITLVHDIPEYSVPHQHRVHHGVRIPFEVILTEHRQPLTRT